MKKKSIKDEQLEMFENFGMIFLVEYFIEKGEVFCEEALLRFLDLPSPLTTDHVIKYLALGYELPESAQVKLLTKPELQNGISEFYLLEHALCPKAQMTLLSRPDNGKLAKNYLFMHTTDNTADRYIAPEFLEKAKELGLVPADIKSEWNTELPVVECELETHW